MYKIVLPFLLASFLNAAVYDGVAIVVKDKAITLLDIKNKMQESKLTLKQASDMLIREKLESIEIKTRKITVSDSEVFDEIKKTASRNKMSVNKFYEAVMNTNGINSTQLKAKIKQKIISQKLYSSIAYASMEEPNEEALKEYFSIHKDDFKHPSEFTVVIYRAKTKEILQEKIHNPMFYVSDISKDEQVLPYKRISKELSALLIKTGLGEFTPVVPDQEQGYMSFYIKNISEIKEPKFNDMKNKITNTIMSQKRESVLSDYFARLRQNTDIKTLRVPQ